MSVRLLLVENEPTVAAFVKKGLADEGFQVEHTESLREGTLRAARESYELIVIDRRLPDGDGLDLVLDVRGRGVTTPIMVLSALADLDARVKGLNAGADDYLGKPFAVSELMARLRALLRRVRNAQPVVLKAGDLELDPTTRRVHTNGAKLDLTQREFALLHLFLCFPCATLSRTTIGEHVWNHNFESSSNVIDVYVRRLRKKLKDAGAKTTIATVRGTGYHLASPAASS